MIPQYSVKTPIHRKVMAGSVRTDGADMMAFVASLMIPTASLIRLIIHMRRIKPITVTAAIV